MNLKGMAPLGIPVNKFGGQARNLSRLVNEVYESDNQVLVFPAGLCSREIDGKIQDIEWGKSFIRKSKDSGRDVVPVHFEGENSRRFYKIAKWQKKLGLKFNVAMMLLPDEMYRSKGRKYRIKIGEPIPVSSFDSSKNDFEWAQEVRQKVYNL
jgi:putative hemolysin